MTGMNSWWSGLSPTSKRNLAVGSIGTVLVGTIIALASFSPEVAKPSNKQAVIQHILTDSDPRSLGIDGISAQLRDLLQKNEEQSRRLAAIEEQQKRENQSDEQRFKQWTTAEREAYDAKLKVVAGELEMGAENGGVMCFLSHLFVMQCGALLMVNVILFTKMKKSWLQICQIIPPNRILTQWKNLVMRDYLLNQ